MNNQAGSPFLMGFFREITNVLSTPISASGRLLSASDLRRKRSEKARQRLTSSDPAPIERSSSDGRSPGPGSTLMMLQGIIEPGQASAFSIQGVDFMIEDSTWIVGDVKLGAGAVIKGFSGEDGIFTARSIVIQGK